MNLDLEKIFNSNTKFSIELNLLREICLETGLEEEYKWKHPCYTKNGKNIVIIGEFKNYCALNFFKGALLIDSENKLIAPGENSSSARQFRFTSIDQIEKERNHIFQFIQEAIINEELGKKVEAKKLEEYDIPEELKTEFNNSKEFKISFFNLSPGRQKAYLIFFSSAKNSKTIKNRIEKYKDRILDGKGINDCVCGMTKKKPSCDGSHKYLRK